MALVGSPGGGGGGAAQGRRTEASGSDVSRLYIIDLTVIPLLHARRRFTFKCAPKNLLDLFKLNLYKN